MTFVQLYNGLIDSARKVYDEHEASSIARILFEHLTKKHYSEVFSSPSVETEISDEQFKNIKTRIENSCPLQYIMGYGWLGDFEFYVNEDVLIPRPETEELVRWVAKENCGCRKLLDIGTGSGCIAISCALMLPGTEVSAVDVSLGALAVARKNAEKHNVNVHFEHVDILTESIAGKFDVIVSNPPYVTESEKMKMCANVLDYEPSLALFVADNNPLQFYVRIAQLGRELLNQGGLLYFEINESFGRQTVDMLTELGYTDVELRRDIFDRDRMVRAKWNQLT